VRANENRPDQHKSKRPECVDEQPVDHRAETAARIGQAHNIQADHIEHIEPACKCRVEADAVDGLQRGADLIKGNDNLELGLDSEIRGEVAEMSRPLADARAHPQRHETQVERQRKERGDDDQDYKSHPHLGTGCAF
jgi:hypothetical protein